MERVRRSEGEASRPERRAAVRPAEAVLRLQRMAGNRAVRQLLRGRKKGGAAGSAEQKALKAAKNQRHYKFSELPDAAQTALREILAGRAGPYLRPNEGKHSTDPETGLPKAQGVGVREYHVSPSNESHRLVVRTVGQDKRAYWDPKHTAGTYTYHRIDDPPFPAPAPAPAPVAPAPAPAVVPAAAAPVPVPAAAAVVPDNWDD
jgi:guanyl-specific ribonuclease Sa